MAKRPTEPYLWLLFSAGGMVAALFFPILVFLLGVAIPLGWIGAPRYQHLLNVAHNPLTILVLVVVFFLALMHWAHRFKYTLYDGLQIKHLNGLINFLCYGGAIVGAILTIVILVQVP